MWHQTKIKAIMDVPIKGSLSLRLWGCDHMTASGMLWLCLKEVWVAWPQGRETRCSLGRCSMCRVSLEVKIQMIAPDLWFASIRKPLCITTYYSTPYTKSIQIPKNVTWTHFIGKLWVFSRAFFGALGNWKACSRCDWDKPFQCNWQLQWGWAKPSMWSYAYSAILLPF